MIDNKIRKVLFWIGFVFFYVGICIFAVFSKYDDGIYNVLYGIGFIMFMVGTVLIFIVVISEGIQNLRAALKEKKKPKKETKEDPMEKVIRTYRFCGTYVISVVKALSGKFIDLVNDCDDIVLRISNDHKLTISTYSDALGYIPRDSEYNRNYCDFSMRFILCNSESFRRSVKEIESGIVIAIGTMDAVAAVVSEGKICNAIYFDIDEFFLNNLFLMFRKGLNEKMSYPNLEIECVDSMRKTDDDDITIGALNIAITNKIHRYK